MASIMNDGEQQTQVASELQYSNGFGNEHESEALAGALPQGQFTPQRVPYGLYAEKLSGTAFTAPRAANLRTWFYRIRPSVKHGAFRPLPQGLLRSAPITEVATPPDQLRWDPFPIPDTPVDFIDGLITLAANGDMNTQSGVGIHVYCANKSMDDRFFYNADGELLLFRNWVGSGFIQNAGFWKRQPAKSSPFRVA